MPLTYFRFTQWENFRKNLRKHGESPSHFFAKNSFLRRKYVALRKIRTTSLVKISFFGRKYVALRNIRTIFLRRIRFCGENTSHCEKFAFYNFRNATQIRKFSKTSFLQRIATAERRWQATQFRKLRFYSALRRRNAGDKRRNFENFVFTAHGLYISENIENAVPSMGTCWMR